MKIYVGAWEARGYAARTPFVARTLLLQRCVPDAPRDSRCCPRHLLRKSAESLLWLAAQPSCGDAVGRRDGVGGLIGGWRRARGEGLLHDPLRDRGRLAGQRPLDHARAHQRSFCGLLRHSLKSESSLQESEIGSNLAHVALQAVTLSALPEETETGAGPAA